MKKVVFILVINFVCLYFSFGQFIDIPMFDIKTPMGNVVQTWITEEIPNGLKKILDDDDKKNHQGAIQILVYDGFSSTRTFNCHGYAWVRVEHGIDRTLGYNDDGVYPEDYYIADESFIEVPQPVYPGKVYWHGNRDHSAITTEHPDTIISKWYYGPLCKHHWNDSPYADISSVKFYVRNCALLGNETVNFGGPTANDKHPININLIIKSCGNINIKNVEVIDNAKLKLDAPGEVVIESGFEMELGTELEVK